ncbi:hypothetical protein ACXYMU_13545 [Pontibacter sp. CAU 1760]
MLSEFLVTHPNIASKRWVYHQHRHHDDQRAFGCRAIVKVKGTDQFIVVTVDCNSRYVYSDPKRGIAIAVAEAAYHWYAGYSREQGQQDDVGLPERRRCH